jgi:hypothetical protein
LPHNIKPNKIPSANIQRVTPATTISLLMHL